MKQKNKFICLLNFDFHRLESILNSRIFASLVQKLQSDMNIASSRVAFLKYKRPNGGTTVWEGYYLVASKQGVWHTMALPFRF
jgi:hypothetical protein